MKPPQRLRDDTAEALPACTTEEHPAGYDYRSRFPHARLIGGGEGGSVRVADDASGAYIITDESTLASLLGEEEVQGMSFVVIRRFGSVAERDRYCERRFGPLIQAMEISRNLW